MVSELNVILKGCAVEVAEATLTPVLLLETDNPEEVLAKAKETYLASPDNSVGWLCFTDKVQIVPDEYRFAEGDDRILLSGELARGNVSLHIRQADQGWQLFELTRTDGGKMLMVQESFLSIYKEGKKLRYENYWQKGMNAEKLEVYQPFTSRFAGFEGGK